MDLTYSVPTGRYGVRVDLDTNGHTFGTQGAVVCVIVLVKKLNGDLFCGHMDCGISGQPGNKDTVIRKAKELVEDILSNDKDNANWWISSQKGGDPTNGWMREGIKSYFSQAPITDSETTDAAFSRANDQTTVMFGNDYRDGEAVNNGAFSVEP